MTNYKGKKEFKIGAMLVAVLFLLNMVLPVHVYGFDTNATFEQGSGTITSTTNELGGNDINAALAGNSQLSGTDFGLGVNDRLFVTGGDLLMNQVGSDATHIFGSAFSDFVLGWFNPNGVFIHDTANIQASGVIAAAMSLNTALNGQYLLQDGGLVVNDGTINATNFVLLAGGAIENTGTINAPVGEVHIAAGDVITVGLNGNGSISVGIDAPVAKQILDEEGNPITDQIKNAGTITANRVSLQAKAAQGIFDYAINQEGIIRVTAVQEKDGIIELIADGDIKSSGTLEGDKLIERGASFKLSGNYMVKESEIDNLDGAINLGTGNYSGVISDVMNIIVDPNAVITLVDTLRLIADSDGNGTGAFIMGDGSSIVGNNHNLGISSAEDAILRTIDNVDRLAVAHIDPAATPVFQMKENISSLGNLIISEGTTFKVEGGSGGPLGPYFTPELSFDNPNTIITNNGTLEIETGTVLAFILPFGLQGRVINLGGDTGTGTVHYTGSNGFFGNTVIHGGDFNNVVIDTAPGINGIFGLPVTGSGLTVRNDLTVNNSTIGFANGQQLAVQGNFVNNGMAWFTDDVNVNLANPIQSGNGTVIYNDTMGTTHSTLDIGGEYNSLIFLTSDPNGTVQWDVTGNLKVNDSLINIGMDMTDPNNPTLMQGGTVNMDTHNLDMTGATGQTIANFGLPQSGANNVYNNGVIEYNIESIFIFGTRQGTITNANYNTDAGTVRYTGGSLFHNIQGGEFFNIEINAGGFGTITGPGITAHGDFQNNNGFNFIGNGQTLDVQGNFENNSVLVAVNDVNVGTFTNDTDSGTIAYLTTDDATRNLQLGPDYNNVFFASTDPTLSVPGNGIWNAPVDMDVNGDFVQLNGTFNAPSNNMTVAGNFIRDPLAISDGITGTFNANGGTVILDGGNQVVTGSTTFNNFEKIGPNETLLFQSGSTQTIMGTATLRGDGSGNMTLNEISGIVNLNGLEFDLGPAGQWNIDPQGARDISFVSVGNSVNLTGPAINPLNSVNLGNTVLWFGNIPTPGGNGAGTGITGNIGNALLAEEQPQLPGIEIGTTFLKNKIYHCAATQAGIDMPSSVHNGVMLNSPDEKLPVGVCGEINPKDIGFGVDEFQTNADAFVPFQFVN